MVTNLQAAKELLAHYKSLTLTELEIQWEKVSKDYEDSEEPFINGGDVMNGITGFGTVGSCPLCNACNTNCEFCIYSVFVKTFEDYPCLDTTYFDVEDSMNPQDLYDALQFRIDRLQNAIDIYERELRSSKRTS